MRETDTSHYPKDVPFEVPKGWVWTTLESIAIDMADGPFGSNLKREHYTSRKEARIIQLSNIGENGWKEDNTKYTSFKHANEISRSIVKPGEIVIAKMMPAGRAIICPEHEMMFVLSSDAIKYVPSHFVYNRYLLFCINSPIVLSQIQSEVHGVTRARTSIEKLRHYRVPLPPFGEQKRIVKQIEYWLTTIGLLDEGKDRLETLVSQCRERVLSLAFTGKLVPQNPSDEPAIDLLKRINPIFQPSHNLHYVGALPSGWVLCCLEDVLDYKQPQAYIVNSTDYSDDYKTPVLTPGKSFVLGYTNEEFGICDRLPVIIFDDFTTESKYVDFPFKVKSSAMKILRSRGEIDLRYIALFMSITRLAGDTHKRYWISEYSKIPIPIPPLGEQIRIVESIKNHFQTLDSIRNLLQD